MYKHGIILNHNTLRCSSIINACFVVHDNGISNTIIIIIISIVHKYIQMMSKMYRL